MIIVIAICCLLFGIFIPYILAFFPAILVFYLGIKYNWGIYNTLILVMICLGIEGVIFYRFATKRSKKTIKMMEENDAFVEKLKKKYKTK